MFFRKRVVSLKFCFVLSLMSILFTKLRQESKLRSFSFLSPIKNDDDEAVSSGANLLDWTDVNEELEIMQKV